MPDGFSDDYYRAVIERMAKDIEDLSRQVRNPSPPYVTQEVYEYGRTSQGERIGALESNLKDLQRTLSKINYTAWTAIVLPLVVAAVGLIMASAVNSP